MRDSIRQPLAGGDPGEQRPHLCERLSSSCFLLRQPAFTREQGDHPRGAFRQQHAEHHRQHEGDRAEHGEQRCQAAGALRLGLLGLQL